MWMGLWEEADTAAALRSCFPKRAAAKRLEPYGQRVRLVRSNFCQMAQVLKECGSMAADGILLDLGVSSYQLDTLERGFSYKYDTVLDMRMDRRQTLTAKEIVNTYSK